MFKKVKSVTEAKPREMCLTHIYCTTLSRMFVRILACKGSKLWITDNSAKLPQLCPRGNLLLEFIHSSGWGGGEHLFEFDWGEEGVGAYSRLDAYSNKYGTLSRVFAGIFKYQMQRFSWRTCTIRAADATSRVSRGTVLI